MTSQSSSSTRKTFAQCLESLPPVTFNALSTRKPLVIRCLLGISSPFYPSVLVNFANIYSDFPSCPYPTIYLTKFTIFSFRIFVNIQGNCKKKKKIELRKKITDKPFTDKEMHMPLPLQKILILTSIEINTQWQVSKSSWTDYI